MLNVGIYELCVNSSLLAITILVRLIDNDSTFASLIPEVATPIFLLTKEVSNIDSKLTIFEFFEFSIVGKQSNILIMD